MAITISFQDGVELFLNYLKDTHIKQKALTGFKQTLQRSLKRYIAKKLKYYPLNTDNIDKYYSIEKMYGIKSSINKFNTYVENFSLKNKTFGKLFDKMNEHFIELSPVTLHNIQNHILKVISCDIDKLMIDRIPEKTIKKCMVVSDNLSLLRSKRFFKFLIHNKLLDRKYLPVYQNRFFQRIKKECDIPGVHQDTGILNLKKAKCVFFKDLLNKNYLKLGGLKGIYYPITAFLSFIGEEKKLNNVKRDKIIQFPNYLKHERKNSSSSIMTNLTFLRRFFRFFTENGMIKSNPANNIKIKKDSKINNITLDENELSMLFQKAYLNYHKYENCIIKNQRDKLYQWLSARDWAVISLLICTGIRAKEITSLYTNDINFKERYIKIEGKGDHNYSVRERIIPITQPLVLSALEIYLKLKPKSIFPHLFITQRFEPLTVNTTGNIIIRIKKQAGIQQKVSITDIRKSHISLCAQKGLDPLVLKEVMGHNSLATTMKYYLTVKEQYLKELWEKNNPLNYFKNKEYKEWAI